MKSTHLLSAVALGAALIHSPAAAQSHDHSGDHSAHGHPPLHVNPRWRECSFQLDPALTQGAWRQFTREAGLVSYFRPLASARAMGRGKFELSVLQYDTRIDDSDPAWNDTFVHPDSAHVLFEGEGLKFPGLMLRAGVTDRTDVGLYFTKSPGANYGFVGAEVQRTLVTSASHAWSAAARVSAVTMYGPADLDFAVAGADLVASRTVTLARWASLAPYVGVSGYLARSHETTTRVDLADEHVVGTQAMAGVELRLFAARFAVEASAARVSSISLKIGVGR